MRLVMLGEENAHCLTQLAACVGQDDARYWHDRLLNETVEIEDIWQSRLDQLSDQAIVAIEFLAIAGGPIRLSDLGRPACCTDAATKRLRSLSACIWSSTRHPNGTPSRSSSRAARSIVTELDPRTYGISCRVGQLPDDLR